jgi:DNA-directed RNA polymerase beta subunit
MEGYREHEILKKHETDSRLFDVITGLIFAGLITLGLIFLVKLLLLVP